MTAETLKPTIVDGTHIPDCIPILSVLAANINGKTQFVGSHRLRLKESDRLEAMERGLSILGARILQTEDGLIVHGGKQLKGGTVDSFGDHRIAMSLAITALGASGSVTITDPQSVDKSYPDFYDDFRKLGGKVHVLKLG